MNPFLGSSQSSGYREIRGRVSMGLACSAASFTSQWLRAAARNDGRTLANADGLRGQYRTCIVSRLTLWEPAAPELPQLGTPEVC